MSGVVHVIGAGMAGLAAAVHAQAAGRMVHVWDAAPQAGGRCRSYRDPQLDCVIDNGNHLVLSGNTAIARLLAITGASDRLVGPAQPCVPFHDGPSGRSWAVRPNVGRMPWWVLRPNRRPPGFGFADIRAAIGMLRAGPAATLAPFLPQGRTRAAFWDPLILAVMNAPAALAAARPMAQVLRETFGRGGAASRPLVARTSLADTFVDPAVDWLQARGAQVTLGRRIRALDRDGDGAVRSLQPEGGDLVAIGTQDRVILAVPPAIAASLVPDCPVPVGDTPIVNVHFLLNAAPQNPAGDAPLIGLVGTTAHWVFLRDRIASVTISAADALVGQTADAIIHQVWPEVASALALPGGQTPPPARVVKEKRATFLQTPANQALRPDTARFGRRLVLAGDWTDTGLPATIEGSVRSGEKAAFVALQPA